MTIDEIYAIPVDGDGWRLLPSGNKLMIGPNVQAPDGINLSRIGAWARIVLRRGSWSKTPRVRTTLDRPRNPIARAEVT